jgi:branched-chain amino acid transport system ATP-binding protein
MSAPAIELRKLEKSFGLAKIIQGVDLSIAKGERHAIIGPNGAGKSTLFNLITGKYMPTNGSVHLHGTNVNGKKPFEINRMGLSRSFQITNIFHNMTVFENVRCGLMWSMGYKYSFWNMVNRQRDLTEKADAVLEQINLTSRRNMVAGALAYAEQRALEIGITIAGGADIIMLDEPCAGMSHSETDLIFDLADKISVLVYGEIIESDTPENVRASKAVQEAYLGTTLEDA